MLRTISHTWIVYVAGDRVGQVRATNKKTAQEKAFKIHKNAKVEKIK